MPARDPAGARANTKMGCCGSRFVYSKLDENDSRIANLKIWYPVPSGDYASFYNALGEALKSGGSDRRFNIKIVVVNPTGNQVNLMPLLKRLLLDNKSAWHGRIQQLDVVFDDELVVAPSVHEPRAIETLLSNHETNVRAARKRTFVYSLWWKTDKK